VGVKIPTRNLCVELKTVWEWDCVSLRKSFGVGQLWLIGWSNVLNACDNCGLLAFLYTRIWLFGNQVSGCNPLL